MVLPRSQHEVFDWRGLNHVVDYILTQVSYTYRLAQIGDCQPVIRSTETSFQIGPGQVSLTLFNLQPWRTYQYKLKAPTTYFKVEEIVKGVFSTRPICE